MRSQALWPITLHSQAASASEEKVEQIELRLLMNQQVRAFAHSTPALQLDDLARVLDATSLALVEDLFHSDVHPHCSSSHLHH